MMSEIVHKIHRFALHLRWTHPGILGMLFLLLIASCDVIEAPFIESTGGGDSTVSNPRKVMIFDFTGHTCKSCPKAHTAISQLKGLYGDRLVPVAFHLGYFAKPLTTGKFTTDFRTPEGTLLESYFDFISFPIGTVQSMNKEGLQPYPSWPASVAAAIEGESPLKIRIVPEYLPGLSAITPEVYVTALEKIEGPVSLAVYLVEDGIVDWQKDEDFSGLDNPDYIHNHVFRTSLSGLWGQRIGSDQGMDKGYIYEIELSKTLNPAWKTENCSIIAFVYREDTKEIIQVESVDL